jgi:oligopeptide transport system substrate-binding protein
VLRTETVTRALGWLLAAWACLVAGLPTALAETAIRRSSTGEAQTLDPQRWTYGQDGNLAQDLFQGLTTVDSGALTVPGQAESWTISPDGRTYTFRLRDRLQWSDGRPIDSGDFVWSLRRLFDPATAAPAASLLYVIRNAKDVNAGRKPLEQLGVRAAGPRTLVIELEHPAPYLLDLLVHRAFPVPRHVVEKWGKEWTRSEHIVSNGAFVLGEWRPGGHVKLLRNPRFHAASSVAIDAVYHVPVEDPKSALLRYRSGELDVAVSIPSEQLDVLRRELGAQLRLVRGLGIEYLAFNLRKPELADPRLRRALSMAIDRELLSQRILRAGEPPAYGMVPAGLLNYPQPGRADFGAWPAPRRMAEARRLLAEVGVGPQRPLRLRFRVNNADLPRRVALAVAAMWQPLGVQVEVIAADLKSHQQAVQQADFDVARGAWYGEDRDAVSFLRLLDGRAGALNLSGYRNPAYDARLDEAEALADPVARARRLQAAEALAMQEQPLAPLYFYVSRRLVSPRVVGWVDNPRGVHLSRYLSVAVAR